MARRQAVGLARTWSLLAACAALVLVVGACRAEARTQTVRGILITVDGQSIEAVRAFTLRTDDGRELRFEPAPDFNRDTPHAMTPGHLRQHMALAETVTVTYREESSGLVALSATD